MTEKTDVVGDDQDRQLEERQFPMRLRERAEYAREEKNMTAECDAWYFSVAADRIDAAQATIADLNWIINRVAVSPAAIESAREERRRMNLALSRPERGRGQ